MIKTGLVLVLVVLSGCAVIDDPTYPANKEGVDRFKPIDEKLGYERVEHGIVTVREIQPRSDIVIMPPSIQHVVWQRDGSTMPAAVTPQRSVGKKSEAKPAVSRAVDDWPLLAEDLNFDSEIGRVDMCRPNKSCAAGESCADMVPCEREDELSCFRVKQGDYCLENER